MFPRSRVTCCNFTQMFNSGTHFDHVETCYAKEHVVSPWQWSSSIYKKCFLKRKKPSLFFLKIKPSIISQLVILFNLFDTYTHNIEGRGSFVFLKWQQESRPSDKISIESLQWLIVRSINYSQAGTREGGWVDICVSHTCTLFSWPCSTWEGELVLACHWHICDFNS